MSIGLADDPDRSPAGMAEHDDVAAGARERGAQYLVAGEGAAQAASVVAQLADLGGGLVHQAGAAAVELTQGTRPEQQVGAAPRQLRLVPRGPGETVGADQEVDARRVAAAHLEAIERRQHALGGGERVDQVWVSIALGAECAHPACQAEAVVADRPVGVLGADQGGVEQLERRRRRPAAPRRPGRPRGHPGGRRSRVYPLFDLAAEILARDQHPDAVLGAQARRRRRRASPPWLRARRARRNHRKRRTTTRPAWDHPALPTRAARPARISSGFGAEPDGCPRTATIPHTISGIYHGETPPKGIPGDRGPRLEHLDRYPAAAWSGASARRPA